MRRRRLSSGVTLSERLATAFASLYFSVPTVALLWLFFNSQIVLSDGLLLPAKFFWLLVAGFAVIGFLFPRFLPQLFSWIWTALLRLFQAW